MGEGEFKISDKLKEQFKEYAEVNPSGNIRDRVPRDKVLKFKIIEVMNQIEDFLSSRGIQDDSFYVRKGLLAVGYDPFREELTVSNHTYGKLFEVNSLSQVIMYDMEESELLILGEGVDFVVNTIINRLLAEKMTTEQEQQ